MARLPAPDRLNAKVVTPVATPVDRFERSSDGQGLAQLSEALRTVAPALQRFSDVKFDVKTSDDKKRAQAVAESSKADYAQAIKDGLIGQHESPWFQMYYQQTHGQVSALKYGGDLQVYIAKELQDATPEEYDAKVKAFRETWMKTNAPDAGTDFQTGFAGQANGVEAGRRSEFISQHADKLASDTDNDTYTAIQGNLDIEAGRNDPTTLNARVAELVTAQTRRYVASGGDGTKANNLATQAVLTWAVRNGRPDVIEALKGVITNPNSPGANLYNRQSMAKDITDALREARSARISIAQGEEVMREAQYKATIKDLQGKSVASVMGNSEDPTWRLENDPSFAALTTAEPEIAKDLLAFRSTVAQAQDYTDPTRYRQYVTAIWDTTNGIYREQDLIREMNANPGGLTKNDIDTLLRDIADRDVARSRGIDNDEYLNASLSHSRGIFDKAYKGDGSGVFWAEFDGALRKSFIQWRMKDGLNATEVERQEWVKSHERLILARTLPPAIARKAQSIWDAVDSNGKIPLPDLPSIDEDQLKSLTDGLKGLKRGTPLTYDQAKILADAGVPAPAGKDGIKVAESWLIQQSELLKQWPSK